MKKLSNLYFAYGSNTNAMEMESRCPNAERFGIEKLLGYRLAYRSGLLTVVKDEKCETLAAAWVITNEHLKTLDIYEGYPTLYGKEKVQGGIIYTMQPPYSKRISTPSENYHLRCLKGYMDCGIDTEQLELAFEEVRV
jgi:gamma-glutamylcyclotransferase (GGCT)/AIG2-like uncharacterized protein YtfP